MAYRMVEISIPRKQTEWFRKRREFPVAVLVNQQSAIWAGETFEFIALEGGYTAVLKRGATLPWGEFSRDTIRHTLSENAAKDIRVLRAAMTGATYDVPVAFELADGALVHPGACYDHHRLCVVRRHHRIKDEDLRCHVCNEAFE
jgi:hypothetical protein